MDARDVLERPACAVIYLRAVGDAWRERMDAWERAELARFDYKAKDVFARRGYPAIVREPKRLYQLTPDDYEDFYAERARYLSGLGVSAGVCPVLEAEGALRLAEGVLIDAAQEFFPPMTRAALLDAGLALREEYISALCAV